MPSHLNHFMLKIIFFVFDHIFACILNVLVGIAINIFLRNNFLLNRCTSAFLSSRFFLNIPLPIKGVMCKFIKVS